MNFKPKSEEELTDPRFVPEGIYDFEVKYASETKSANSQKSMIELKIRIHDGAVSKTITDYLHPRRPLKLRHAAAAMGLIEKYDLGTLVDKDFLGRRGKVHIGMEQDANGKYPDKNVVVDYVGAGDRRTLPAPGESKLALALAALRREQS